MHQKGYFSWLEAGSGHVIANNSKAGELREAFSRVVHKYGTSDLSPPREKNYIYNFYLKMPVTAAFFYCSIVRQDKPC